MGSNEQRQVYHILYTQVMDQDKIKPRLEKKLEGTDSEIFIPRMEYYCRGDKAVKIKPIFPGYTFVRTSIDPLKLRETVRDTAKETQIGIRELGFEEQKYHPCISIEEEEFLDFFCTGEGLLEMSVGYQEGNRYVVMDGPLKPFEDMIANVDKHNRKAFLKFEVDGRKAQAGFECKPKAHWFEDSDSKLATLSDGSEVDLNELRQKVLSAK